MAGAALTRATPWVRQQDGPPARERLNVKYYTTGGGPYFLNSLGG